MAKKESEYGIVDRLLGELIKRMLIQKGKTQKWLANEISMTPPALNRIVKGSRKASEAELIRIAAALDSDRHVIKLFSIRRVRKTVAQVDGDKAWIADVQDRCIYQYPKEIPWNSKAVFYYLTIPPGVATHAGRQGYHAGISKETAIIREGAVTLQYDDSQEARLSTGGICCFDPSVVKHCYKNSGTGDARLLVIKEVGDEILDAVFGEQKIKN